MLRVLELNNFRGFEELRLAGLGRFNIITGLNGSGKTSILEALFLISGGANASLTGSLFGFRGERGFIPGSDRLFRWLFKNLDPNIAPRIVAATTELMITQQRYRRELVIKPTYAVGPAKTSTAQEEVLRGVTFEFQGPSGKATSNFGWSQEWEKLLIEKPKSPAMLLGAEPTENPDLVNGVFISPYVRDLIESDHQNLTKLTTERRIQEVVEPLKLITPTLKSLHPLTDKKEPVIFADVGGKALLPISLLGAGLVNCLHIVLPSVMLENGILLFDEFEDGIHHTLHQPILKIVMDLARQRKNQVFITTHSNELLRNFIDLANSEKEKEVSFFRLGRLGMKGLVPRYTVAEAEELLEQRADIR